MGNKIARHAELVDERYTRPQGPYEYNDGDCRKLRRLILNGRLAPCYPGAEEYSPELDDCPICFLYYPRLNKSKCCSKPICTECYLQMKSMAHSPFVNCPFCKTSNYTVEYRGAKTVAEKKIEQAEEQRVIEAKIRILQKELLDEEQCLQRCGENRLAEELNLISTSEHGLHAYNYNGQHLDQCEELFEHELFDEHGFEEECCLQDSFSHLGRDGENGLDMEDIMVMKAIWLSIQEQGQRTREPVMAQLPSATSRMNEFALRRCSGSVGFSEIQGDGVASGSQSLVEHRSCSHMASVKPENLHARSRIINIPRRWPAADTASIEDEEATWGMSAAGKLHLQTERGSYEEMDGTMFPMVPESFDEQVKLAMALSLADAEARAR